MDAATHGGAGSTDIADTIVVGHDGSADADGAYAYALSLAQRLGAPVLVMRAWTVDTAPRGTLFSDGGVSPFGEASQKVARLLERDAGARATAHPEVRVEFRAKYGQPSSVLIGASTGALMLVVGRRGRGGFPHLRLGSVSEQCTRHAHCPVLVVRPHDAHEASDH